MMRRAQLARAWHIAVKDMRTYYLKPPAISWGMLFPGVMILAFYLRDPAGIRGAVPGLLGMTMLFGGTSIEAVAIAFEKRIGAMERLLMAPISSAALVLGKGASGAIFALASGSLVWLLSSLIWGLSLRTAALVLLVLLLGATTYALMGVVISLVMREVFDAMTLSNYLRFPMVFLCGVFLPLAAMPPVLRVVASLLPLSYTVDALRHLLLGGVDAFYPLWLDLGLGAVFSVALYALSLALVDRRLEDLL